MRLRNRARVASQSQVIESGPVFPITAIAENGWSATYPSPPTFVPDVTPETFTVTRQGFDSSGTATSLTEALTITARIRQPFPNQATLTADQVALSDYVYSTDTIAGVTNNSTEASPKPIANWAMPDRRVVGNSLTLQVVAFHRNARNREQVACVEFTVSDGTTVITQRVSTSSVLTSTTDVFPVVGYQATIDISTLLNPATLTCNAKIYPHFGEALSVLDSAAQSAAREFSPRTFRRDTTLAASPVFVYVSTSGIDATGVVSTNAATAKATPCLTIGGAINRLVSVNGSVDGCEIRMMSGTHTINSTGITTTRTQTHSALTITRDPDEILTAVTLQLGVTFRPRLGAAGGWLTIRDIQIVRISTTQPIGEAASPLEIRWQSLPFDNGSINTSIVGSNAHLRFDGVIFQNSATSMITPATPETRIMRGCTATGSGSIEGWLVLGCHFTSPTGTFQYGSRTANGSIIAFSRVTNSPSGTLIAGTTLDVAQIAWVQNLFEFTSGTSNPTIRISADSATGSNSHVLLMHNTFAGFYSHGRGNLFYEDGPTARTSKLSACKGNIHVQLNTKGDVFVADGTRLGNWPYLFGVGCQGEFSQFVDADAGGLGGLFAQAYPGLGASIGTSTTVRNDPLFVAYAGTTSVPSAGAGGGNYRLNSGSPADNRVAPVLRFDLDGAERSSVAATSGAYEL